MVFLSSSVMAIADPSAVYCEEMGYTYGLDKASDGEKGICVVKPGVEFKAWDFFRGKVGGEYSYCAKKGYGTETERVNKETYLTEYAVCVSRKTFIDNLKRSFGIKANEVKISMHELMEENGDSLDLKPFEIRGEQEKEADYNEALGTYKNDSLEITTDSGGAGSLPSSFDWRNYNGEDWVTSVKYQGGCGSCWAFSALGAVEAKLNIDNNNSNLNYDLSEQQLVSCSSAGSCAYGWNYKALNYVRDTGISDEDCFPYVAADVSCTLCSNWQDRKVGITDNHRVTATQAALKQALLDYGPLSVPVQSKTNWEGYSGGILVSFNQSKMDHLVLLVGYNDTGGYWIIKNSWGTSWGEDGYIRLSYTNNPITSFDVTYAVDQTILPIGSGELQSYLINPVSPINITKNKLFNFSTGVKCVDGYCGDVTATLTLPPSEMTTCSEVWGGDCSGAPGSFDNTFDDCSSGAGGLESIGEVYIDKSSVEFGEEVTVACYFDIINSNCGTVYPNDNLYIYYRNSSSGAWQKKYHKSSVHSCQNYSTSFFPDNVEGEHQVRCIAEYELNEGECGDGSWFDNDDANFSVHNHSTGKGKVPMNYGNPFYTINQNPVICVNMTNQSTCNQTWTINTTGDINSSWLFYTIYSSPNLPGVKTNKTEKINLTIIEFTNNILNIFIELFEGWNLVSLPLSPLDNTLPNVLSSIQKNYSKVVAYDANDIGNESKIYDPNDLLHSNLNSIEKEIGVWINMLNNDTLLNEGYKNDVVNFNLKEGYNLISYPSLDENNVSYVFGNVSDDLVNILTYENNEWKSYSPAKPTILNNLTIIKPGQAYWVEVNDTVSWDFIDGKFSSH